MRLGRYPRGRVWTDAAWIWLLTRAIFLTLTAFNLLGQGLRDAMDPKLRR